ncbi:MAG: phage tail sheath protein FI [Crocinitomicaceae bacterium]|jgi:phage tail sheath protein FI
MSTAKNSNQTISSIEEECMPILHSYLDKANDDNTWMSINSELNDLLSGFWKKGELSGATESAAYLVECGLGSTMSPEDLLNEIMIVEVTFTVKGPSELSEKTNGITSEKQVKLTYKVPALKA